MLCLELVMQLQTAVRMVALTEKLNWIVVSKGNCKILARYFLIVQLSYFHMIDIIPYRNLVTYTQVLTSLADTLPACNRPEMGTAVCLDYWSEPNTLQSGAMQYCRSELDGILEVHG